MFINLAYRIKKNSSRVNKIQTFDTYGQSTVFSKWLIDCCLTSRVENISVTNAILLSTD